MAWNGKSFTGIRSCQSGSVCTKREELSLRFSWRSADSDRQQLSRKSGKTFCHRQEKLAIFHLAERSRRQCRSLFNHQHSTGKRHWCQRVSDKHLPHRTKMITAEIWIKHPPRRCHSFERDDSSGVNSICCDAGLFGGYDPTSRQNYHIHIGQAMSRSS